MAGKRRKSRLSMRGADRSSMPPLKHDALAATSLASFERQRCIRLGLPMEVKNHLTTPYGFVVDEDRPHMLKPIQEIFELLVKAMDYLKKGYTLTDTADFINSHEVIEKYGHPLLDARYLSHLMRTRPPFKEAALPLDEKKRL